MDYDCMMILMDGLSQLMGYLAATCLDSWIYRVGPLTHVKG